MSVLLLLFCSSIVGCSFFCAFYSVAAWLVLLFVVSFSCGAVALFCLSCLCVRLLVRVCFFCFSASYVRVLFSCFVIVVCVCYVCVLLLV